MAAGGTLAVKVTGVACLQALVESVRAVACLGQLSASVKVQQQVAVPAGMAAPSAKGCT